MTAMTFDTLSRPVRRPAAAAPVRLTRRGRVLLLLVLATLVLVAFSLGRTSASAGAAHEAPRTAVVQPGETLWSIASRVAPGEDPRAIVARLAELNRLGSAPIVAGQRLVLPG